MAGPILFPLPFQCFGGLSKFINDSGTVDIPRRKESGQEYVGIFKEDQCRSDNGQSGKGVPVTRFMEPLNEQVTFVWFQDSGNNAGAKAR